MTITEEANEIRKEIDRLPPGRSRKYTRAMRLRILDWFERAEGSGMCPGKRLKLLGLQYQRIESWRESEMRRAATIVPPPDAPPRPTSTTALMPVAVRDDFPFGPGVSFRTPSGYEIMGLTLDQAIGLLRAFA